MEPMPLERLVSLAASGLGREQLAGERGGGAVVVELAPCEADPAVLASLPVVVVGIGAGPGGSQLVDVVVPDAAASAEVVDAVEARPTAATALAMLLRGTEGRRVPDGLVAESSTYSLLQAGPEHRAWLAGRERRERPPRDGDGDGPVRVRRHGAVLRVTLDRPHVRNALDAATRDALLDALAVASADPALHVVLAGSGPAFCSGGDLDEFGTLADPASAHLLRLARSVGYAIHAVADRVTAEVHGHCAGSGVELPAFAGRVVADPGTTFALPEVGMGLVPGAGGTVSIARRVGRHRTAWLALTGRRIGAGEALRWGLADEIGPAAPRK